MDRSNRLIQTEKYLRIVQFGHTARGLAWKRPLVVYCDDTFDPSTYVAEWWTDTKGLTLWFDNEGIYWIKSDRERMDDGYVTCPQDISRLLVWLMCRQETARETC